MAKKKEDPKVEAPAAEVPEAASFKEPEEEVPFVPADKSKEVDWMDEELRKEGRLNEIPC